MGGEVEGIDSLPLLPAGTSLFDALPARAIVLTELAPAIGEGVVTLVDGNRTGLLVIRAGAIAGALSIDGERSVGDAALKSMAAWDAAVMSASRLSDDAMSLLTAVISGERCYEDLRLEWTRWSEFINDLRARGGTYVVEVRTAVGRGVTVVRAGQQVATYTQTHPSLGSPDLLDALTATGSGSLRVTVGSEASGRLLAVSSVRAADVHSVGFADGTTHADGAGQTNASGLKDLADHADGALRTGGLDASQADMGERSSEDMTVTERALRADPAIRSEIVAPSPWASDPGSSKPQEGEPRTQAISVIRGHDIPAAVPDQYDGNATLTALFGDALGVQPFTPLVVLDRMAPPAAASVGSLLPELKLLVQQRLQRSASPVEFVVDAAADGGESVAWLADRVRVMTVRGFMTSTFEQLAEDMLALARE